MEKLFTLTLSLMPKVGRRTIQKIYSRYKNTIITENIFEEAVEILENILKQNFRDNIDKYKQEAINIIEQSKNNSIDLISIFDEDYPQMLREIEDPPVLLYIKGNKECLYKNDSVAIIGTREPTPHGEKIAQRLGEIASERGNVVISGLAKGCDSFAHYGCVKNGGESIAVLPGGLDKVYPSSNKELAKNILKNNGCLVSEYAIGTKPFRNNYVDRDRIQSGLSAAVIVVETDIKGGTMHTVRFALSQNRILACYHHNTKFNEYKQIQGNKELINSGKALSLKNEIDINNLFELIKLKSKSMEFEGNNIDDKINKERYVQITISDIGV